jgi:molybdenum cofactor guanylyltransferase
MAVTASGVVLAGGGGRRMGTDKRLLRVGDRPLLSLAVEAVAAVCADVTVVASAEHPLTAVQGARTVLDRRPDAGPLAGLEAGLLAARGDPVLVLAGDHPAASPAVLADLLGRLTSAVSLEAVVLATGRGPQPLVAAYRRHVHLVAGHLLDRGERRARVLLDHLRVEVVDEPSWRRLDPDGATAVDLDTPEDLAAWEAAR